MRYVEHRPPPPWRSLVRCVWTLEAGRDLVAAPPQRVLPDGRMEIVVHLLDPFRRVDPGGRDVAPRRAVVAGQMTRAVRLHATGTTSCVGVRLEPAGARALFRVPVADLSDRIAPLDDALGADGERWADAVANAPDVDARTRATWAWLATRLSPAARTTVADAAIARWRTSGGTASVEDVASSVGLSRRTLERAFRDDVGVRPKRFARIVRLQRVARGLRAMPRAPLAALAIDAGCFDQAHLAREFGDLAGISPTGWLAEEHAIGAAFLGDGDDVPATR